MAVTDARGARQAGFTLIETLVALALLAIGVTAVTVGFHEGNRVSGDVDQRQRAMGLAQDKLAELLAHSYATVATPRRAAERIEGGALIGEDRVNGISRRWVVEPGFPAPGIARVWVAARWVRRGTAHTYQLAGLLAEGLAP
jgi:prepilin-type N-terminal cleavage/methylation domain-containing protein